MAIQKESSRMAEKQRIPNDLTEAFIVNDKTKHASAKIGDHSKCPQCGRVGRVVWISQDGKRAGIQCPASHSQMSRGNSKFGSAARPQTRPGKNMVFLVKIKL